MLSAQVFWPASKTLEWVCLSGKGSSLQMCGVSHGIILFVRLSFIIDILHGKGLAALAYFRKEARCGDVMCKCIRGWGDVMLNVFVHEAKWKVWYSRTHVVKLWRRELRRRFRALYEYEKRSQEPTGRRRKWREGSGCWQFQQWPGLHNQQVSTGTGNMSFCSHTTWKGLK